MSVDVSDTPSNGAKNRITKQAKNTMLTGEVERASDENALEDIELDLLCEGIYHHYGFDFRNYARSSLRRRTRNLMELEGVKSVSILQDRILHNTAVMERFLLNLSINVTSMFRDPPMFAAFREKIVPILRTYPSIRIWHAGCASGEEVYSLAILLEEEHLADKTKIYATDINEEMIKVAKAGIYPLSSMQEFSENYMASGGKRAFSEYYQAKYDNAIFSSRLRKRIVFSKHNLVSESSFNEFNVIFCRNVMIYFNDTLQMHVHHLLHQSLCRFGVLVLGNSETTLYSDIAKHYKVVDDTGSIFQRNA